jgi:hypothetical protein
MDSPVNRSLSRYHGFFLRIALELSTPAATLLKNRLQSSIRRRD